MDFIEQKPDFSDQTNGFATDISRQTKYAVVFLVEATGKLHRHMETLKSAYLCPILSYFRSINAASDMAGMDWIKHTVYGFVFYYSADAAKGQEVYCGVEPNDNEEAALQWFDNVPVDHAPFIYAHQCCLLEAISAGIIYINRLVSKHFKGHQQLEKHFIIVGQSAPYDEQLIPSKTRPQTMHDAAQLIAENNIHLSVISTRRSKVLRDLFNSSRDINAFAETTANINEQHMVLLNNISIRPQEKFSDPASIQVEYSFSPISAPPILDSSQNQRNLESAQTPILEEKSSSLLQGILDGSQNRMPTRSPAPIVPDVLSPRNGSTHQDITPAVTLTSETHYSPGPMFNQDSPKTSVNVPANRNSPLLLDGKYSVPVPNTTVTQLAATTISSNKLATIPVSRIADEVNSQYPRTGMISQMPRVNSGPNLAQFQPVMNQTPIQPNVTAPLTMPRVVGERCIVWEGIVEWQNQNQNQINQRSMHQVPCEIWVPVNDYIRAERWPSRLTIQFLPANVNQVIHPFMDMPIKINFHFKQSNEAVKDLHERLSKRSPVSFASILFSTSHAPIVIAGMSKGETTTIELRVMVFLFNPSNHTYQGFIPRDQVGFVDALRQLTNSNSIQRQRLAQQQQLQQQQLQQQQLQQQQQQVQMPSSQQIGQQRPLLAGANQYGNYVQQTGSDPNFMQQPQAVQPSMTLGYSQVNNNMPTQQQLSQDQSMRIQQQHSQMQQQQQQQQQNIRFLFPQQQHAVAQPMQMGQSIQNGQDPQLRALLQNSSPNLHPLHFDK